MSISYREAKAEDCYLIAKLKGEVWDTTYRGIYSDDKIDSYDVERNKQSLERIVINSNISLYVSPEDEKIIGFISCGEPYRPFLHYKQDIELRYILKEYQKRGTGKNLFSIAKDIIIKNGYDKFFVSVNKYNTNALDFYIKMGGSIISIDEDKENKSETQIKLHYDILQAQHSMPHQRLVSCNRHFPHSDYPSYLKTLF